MPELYRIGHWKIVMFAFDTVQHSQPHFHIYHKDNSIAVVDLFTCNIIEGRLEKRFAKKLKKWYNENRNFLLVNWDNLSQGRHEISLEVFNEKK